MNSSYCTHCPNPNFYIIQTNEHSVIRKRKEVQIKLLQCIKSHDNQVTVSI
jgi:hypothetical protein